MAGKSVMEPAAEVEANSVLKRQAGGQHAAPGREPVGLHQLPAVGNFQLHDFLVAEGAGLEAIDPSRFMNRQDVGVGGRFRPDEIRLGGKAVLNQAVMNVPEFSGWEHVVSQPQIVALVVNEAIWQHGWDARCKR